MIHSGNLQLAKCGRELAYQRLHEERLVTRSNVDGHLKRLKLCGNNWADGRDECMDFDVTN